ncbi:Endonuclease-reverse transcriptase [Operophtera brumata]|uniref:Endonuclease-reverse transcriptase n=1 Tax=Operophtera brumata TaxID=104452 RepID=A0A0L7LER7_OPEBR|nr:Endonuclease-reverse transcriptase [Operophtera brumata]
MEEIMNLLRNMQEENRQMKQDMADMKEDIKNTINIVDILNNELGLSCGKNSIEAVRRLGRRDGGKTRPIVMTLLTMGLKIQIQKNKKKLENTPYYIKEDYPPEILNKRKELQIQLEKEREQGKMAFIKYDKLIILNNKNEELLPIKTNKRILSESPENKKTIYFVIQETQKGSMESVF